MPEPAFTPNEGHTTIPSAQNPKLILAQGQVWVELAKVGVIAAIALILTISGLVAMFMKLDGSKELWGYVTPIVSLIVGYLAGSRSSGAK